MTRTLAARIGVLLAGVLAGALLHAPPAGAAQVTPGSFTGYGFDQCVTPTQAAMDAWLRSSPYWAVGIYISGDSRACRTQPNQTPAWVRTQIANGWRLLPITLGPQASCSTRFPRYGDDETVDPRSAGRYRAAKLQGRAEAATAVAAAQRLGIDPGSTLWYDMEAYDTRDTACRVSALWFTSAWTKELHDRGYVSGVYSSASSHIAALDDVRVDRPTGFALPDRIWLARWDGVANTSSSYLRPDGWLPGGRMKQYLGGHDETYGGVTINIDSNFLDLGRGSVAPAEKPHCGGVRLNYRRYRDLTEAATTRVDALQCLLTRAGRYTGPVNGRLNARTRAAVAAYRTGMGLSAEVYVGARVWTALLADGRTRLVKYGARGEMVRRLQRSLNAADARERLAVTGVLEGSTTAAVKRYQARLGMARTGVVTPGLWRRLQSGRV